MELIKLNEQNINDQMIKTVNARDLHEFLGSKRKFSDWVKAKIDRLRLRENTDYVTVSQNCEIARGGYQTVIDYFVTLDVAKHIAMMENTDRGFEVRDYFIECERKLTEQHQLPQTFAEALKLAYEQQLLIETQKEQIGIMQPKAEYFDGLVSRNLLTNLRDTAKELGIKQKEFISYLLSNGYLYRDNQNKLHPYAQHTPALFELKEYSNDRYQGVQTLVTPRGRETFRLLLN